MLTITAQAIEKAVKLDNLDIELEKAPDDLMRRLEREQPLLEERALQPFIQECWSNGYEDVACGYLRGYQFTFRVFEQQALQERTPLPTLETTDCIPETVLDSLRMAPGGATDSFKRDLIRIGYENPLFLVHITNHAHTAPTPELGNGFLLGSRVMYITYATAYDRLKAQQN